MSAVDTFFSIVVVIGVGCVIVAHDGGFPSTPPQPQPVTFSPPRAPPAVPQVRATKSGPRVFTVAPDGLGQFWIDGSGNGAALRLLVDTGDSGGVSMSKSDARRVGIDVRKLVFDGVARTANGTVRMAKAKLARFVFGPFVAVDVPVDVVDGDLDTPLLGMALLQGMNFSVANGTLKLSARSM